ncbi:MAG: glycosyltransferase [Desulfovibrio sp.]|nr:glycosyltransferase [Desulfovibrio sp.]
MEKAELSFSILVTTQGRTYELAAFMRSLCQQQGVDCTLIAGMQETPIDPASLVQNPPYAIVHKALPRLSLSQARNALLEEATGDILALADDDCQYPPDILRSVAYFFANNRRCGVLICDNDIAAPRKEKRWQVLHRAPSYTLFFRRSAVVESGLFDESMGIGTAGPWQSGEETDLVLRIMAHGHEVWRIPTPAIRHPEALHTEAVNIGKVMGYARGRMYLLQKHSFSLGFKLLNLVYPLAVLPVEIVRFAAKICAYRLAMFQGRLSGLLLVRRRSA